MPLELTLVQKLAVWALPVLFAITVPELVRAQVAYRLGDSTGQRLGRLSYNPLSFVDLIGTIVFPALMLALNIKLIFGWPRLVPVDFRNFRNPMRAMAILASATLGSNLVMALLWGLVLRLWLVFGIDDEGINLGMQLMALTGIQLNLLLMLLYLVPVPPLPGGQILLALLPPRTAYSLSRVEPYGMLILLLLMASGILGAVLAPPLNLLTDLLFALLGIHT